MALVPPELVSEYYQINKPEIRLEDSIIRILQQNEMPDDLRGKLLSQLIPKYQKSMQPPPPPKPFEIPPELLPNINPIEMNESAERIESLESEDVITTVIAKYLMHAVPKSRKKYIIPILVKLKNAGYKFNDNNELEVNGKPEYRSNAIDLFSHLMRDLRRTEPSPRGFEKFYRGIFEVNIPRQWIGNKNVREQLELSQLDSMNQGVSPTPEASSTPKSHINPSKNVSWSQWRE